MVFLLLGWDTDDCNCSQCSENVISTDDEPIDVVKRKYAQDEITTDELEKEIGVLTELDRLKDSERREMNSERIEEFE